MKIAANVLVAMATVDGRVAAEAVAMLVGAGDGDSAPRFAAAIDAERARGRNALVSAFHADPAGTHLWLVDPDLVLPRDALRRLLAHGRDVVALPVVLPGAAESGEPRFDLGPLVGENGALFVHERASAAAMLLSRAAVDALVDDAKRDGRVYAADVPLVGSDGVAATAVHYECFRPQARDGAWLADDVPACAALRRAGFAIHVDATIVAHRRACAVG